ncbi:hypothetical protein MN202_08950 [Rheinheimera muenzenbergensis]|uniref:Uncharacterized protein n=1 Tax=Rheinheimera muenzenbergensis TaxID=1193628 RepID=A0ABU8C6F0_9GAMM
MQYNQRIAQLVTQLPLQRQQLAGQTTALTQAVCRGLSSPATLAVAAVAGGMLGWRWFKPAQCPEQNNKQPEQSQVASGTLSAPLIGSLLQHSLSSALMAYLARSLA